jgi:Site-specific recombinases, DNA invertase Pin homologs
MDDQKKAWLYCRIDAPEDVHGVLKNQKKELLDYAEQMGLEVVGASEDFGSGLLYDRPGLAECMKAASDGKADVLIVKSLSKIGYETEGTLEFCGGWNGLASNSILRWRELSLIRITE